MIPKEELHDMYWVQEMSQSEIAKEIGVRPWNVYNWMKKYGIEARILSEAHLTGILIPSESEFKEMYFGREMSQFEIGKEMGVSTATVHNWIIKYDIKTRTPSEIKLIGVSVPSKEDLEEMYFVMEMPIHIIAKEIGMSSSAVYNLMKKHGTKVRSKSEASVGKFTGKNARNWNGGTSFGKYCNKFNNKFKEAVRKRDDYTCQLCGCEQLLGGQKLDVHHIHYDKDNCYPDVVALCRSCNSNVNSDRNYWEQYFEDQLLQRGLLNWNIN